MEQHKSKHDSDWDKFMLLNKLAKANIRIKELEEEVEDLKRIAPRYMGDGKLGWD